MSKDGRKGKTDISALSRRRAVTGFLQQVGKIDSLVQKDSKSPTWHYRRVK
ncbi:unnamed protein product, partial [Gulo gulo]